jgi:hypothetical protein
VTVKGPFIENKSLLLLCLFPGCPFNSSICFRAFTTSLRKSFQAWLCLSIFLSYSYFTTPINCCVCASYTYCLFFRPSQVLLRLGEIELISFPLLPWHFSFYCHFSSLSSVYWIVLCAFRFETSSWSWIFLQSLRFSYTATVLQLLPSKEVKSKMSE